MLHTLRFVSRLIHLPLVLGWRAVKAWLAFVAWCAAMLVLGMA